MIRDAGSSPEMSVGARMPASYLGARLTLATLPAPSIEEYMSTRITRWSVALVIAFAAPAIAPAQTGKVPALLDRELFFGNPEISGAQISPDGRYISFLKPYKDTRNVWVKRVSDP